MSDKIFSRTVLDAIPSPIFIMNHYVEIYDANKAASEMTGDKPVFMLKRLCNISNGN